MHRNPFGVTLPDWKEAVTRSQKNSSTEDRYASVPGNLFYGGAGRQALREEKKKEIYDSRVIASSRQNWSLY